MIKMFDEEKFKQQLDNLGDDRLLYVPDLKRRLINKRLIILLILLSHVQMVITLLQVTKLFVIANVK